MNLKALMSHWQLKNMVREKHILYSAEIYRSAETSTVRSAKVCTGHTHAIILYTSDGDRMRLIHADIFISGQEYFYSQSTTDKIFIKNANLTQLACHLV